MISFNPKKLIRQLTPTFLRKPIRIAWLEALFSPLIRMWDNYVIWRLERYYESHVTCQTISIKAYLNKLFDPEFQRIDIVDITEDNSVYVALRDEGYDDLFIDGEYGTFLFLESEKTGIGFKIIIPKELELRKQEISGVVNIIRAAGTLSEVVVHVDGNYLYIDKKTVFVQNTGGSADTTVLSNTNWQVV